jgi:ribosomal protein S18 acetylase RimI-like enzyme
MEFAEGFAREQGLDRIELNVMGGNEVARGLYRSLAYDEVAVYMGKTV